MTYAATLLVAWIGILMPALIMRRTFLVRKGGGKLPSREAIYASTWFLQAMYLFMTWWLCRIDDIPFLPPWRFDAYGMLVAIGWTTAKIVLIGIVSIWWKRENLELLSRLAPRLEPKSIFLYAAICCTTGFAEEIVFRVHFPNVLLSSGVGTIATILLSAGVFGFWHAAQGVRGMVLAGILGGGNLLIYWHLGTIYPLMLAHALYDLICGIRVAWLYRDQTGETLVGGPLARSEQ